MHRFVSILLAGFFSLSITSAAVVAQDATPVPSGACTVEPRTQEEVNALAAIAAATPPSESVAVTVRLPQGDPVDEAVISTLLDTLNQADECAKERDILRYLALYSDYFIVTYVFGNEPVGIDSGGQSGPQVNAEGTPIPQVNVIDNAVLVEEGIIAAHVFVSGNSDFGSIVWFVEQDGRWIIQDIASAGDPPAGRSDVPAEAEGIVSRVIEEAAAALDTDPENIAVVSFKSVDWPDAALGCPEEEMSYAAVVTPGYRIVVSDGESTLTFHTDRSGAFVNCSGD
ncbi:MAG: hypothetical protein KF883_02990 [Thermomicrobiales bacterium]|nr:hypothetical protein [Thermomicrobiales bacterium]